MAAAPDTKVDRWPLRRRLRGLADLMLLVMDQMLPMHLVKRHPVMAMVTHEVLAMRAFHMVLAAADVGDLRLGNGRAGRH